MAQLVASRWITDSCAVVRIMLGCDMGFIVGVVIGFLVGGGMAILVADCSRKRSVCAGWIKIDEEIYTLRKADVVEAKSQNQVVG